MSKANTRPRLLFVCLQFTSFVKDDLTLLSEAYDVQVFHFDSNRFSARAGRLWGLLYYGVRQARWLLRELPRARGVYAWFADYHAVLPVILARLFRKPVVVPLAGFDAILLPDLHYGVYATPWRGALARFVIRNAALLLPVSRTMIYSKNRYSAYPEVLENGVAHHVPGFQTPYEVIPFGYDPEAWPAGPAERPPVVCTVGNIESDRTLRRKGVDLLFEAARHLPEVRFQVVGVPPADAERIRARYAPPANVDLLPRRPRAELVAIYGNASVYAQLSRAEGMPNVLCEAMCCGCIPVGSAVFGIPEVIGEAGLVVEEAEPEAIAGAIARALALGPVYRERARQRVLRHFSWAQRRRALLDVLAPLTEQGS